MNPQGDSALSRFTVLVPPGSPGVVNVSVAQLEYPGIAAAFDFEYLDDRVPQASSYVSRNPTPSPVHRENRNSEAETQHRRYSPMRVYNDGGYSVTVAILDFPSVQVISHPTPYTLNLRPKGSEPYTVNPEPGTLHTEP